MKFINKLKTIWKLNHNGFYISLGVIFLGAMMLNVIQKNSQSILFLQMAFGICFVALMIFGIGFLTWSEE